MPARASDVHETMNAALLAAALSVSLLQFLLAPLILPMGAWTALGLVCLCAVTTPLHWGLMHESIHGNLFRDPATNRRAGRVLGNFLCLSWDVMRFGHLLHHSNNRHEFDRPEAVGPGGSLLAAAGPYYLKLLGGHALISCASSIGLALPTRVVTQLVPKAEPMHTAASRAFTNKERQARIRGDLCGTVLLVGLAVVCWGAHWPIFAATIAVRFLMLSLLDNAPHYATAINSGTYARNTSLPRFAHWLVMGHNFHGIHHGATGLRWQELRSAFARAGSAYEGSWTAMVVRQFRGPVVLD
ncbi:MAG TPA: fatty acid desaturase [Rhizomicrobium sp.]|jgi:fatty acid desaturase|nr:fatty acid desaturase [Rhizomicrobium sp.]